MHNTQVRRAPGSRRRHGAVLAIVASLLLAACGPDALTSAASLAASEAAAAKAAKEQKERAQAQIRGLEEANQKHADSVGEEADRASH